MAKRAASTSAQGSAFETEVSHLLRLMGYQVARNQLLAGTQTDLLATKPDRLSNVALIVECTDRAVAVGVPLVKEKAAVLLSYKDPRYIFRLLFVSRSGFTAEAHAYARENPQILLMTPDDLERELIDFTPYADWYVAGYEASTGMFAEGRLFGNYVELTGRDDDGTLVPSLTDHLLRWLGNPEEHLLFILGEFGSGKTSVCRHFVYESLVRRARPEQGPLPPLPLLVNLREFRESGLNLPQVIGATLTHTYGVVIPSFLAVERLASTGRLLLVLDGFDEMADKADRKTLIDCLGQIHLLAALQTKIVLTCRSNFFQSHTDIVELFRQIAVELPAEDESQPPMRVSLERRGRTLHVERLNPQQIEQFVRNRAGDEADAILQKIRTVHDLTDLSTRPVLLDMIVSTIPQLAASKRTLNSAALYDHYTDRWTSRDNWRVAMPLEFRRQFCDSLGWHMQLAFREEIDFPLLERLMTETLDKIADSEEELERFKNDIQTCSFLSRSGSGDSFRFAHKSFREFFVARTVIEHIARDLPMPLSERRRREEEEKSFRFLGTGFRIRHYGASRPSLYMGAIEPLRLRFRFSEPKWRKGGAEVKETLRKHLEVRMRNLLNDGWPAGDRELVMTPEIATFAVEHALNQGYVLADMVRAAKTPELMALLSEILTKTLEIGVFRAEAEAMKRAIRTQDGNWLRVTLSSALCRVPDVLDAESFIQFRKLLPAEGWTQCLLLLADNASPEALSLLRACSALEDLFAVDRLICSRADPQAAQEATIEALVASDNEADQMLVVQLCQDSAVDVATGIRLLSRLLKRTTIKAVKSAVVEALRGAPTQDAWKMLRTIAQSETDPATRKQLFDAEREARNTASRERNRPARSRERREFLDLLRNRLS